MNRDNNQPSCQPLSYWEKERQNGTKPLVKEDPIHRCQLVSFSDKVTLSSLSIFNYTDTITDVLVTIDMFRNESFILGTLSLSVLLYVGVLVPLFLGVNRKWSTGRILSALSFSPTQHYIYTEILRHPKTKLFSRRQGSRSSSQVYFTPIMSRINDAIFFEKITQNQVQLTLQLILVIAQTFSSPPLTMDDLTSWHYIGLLSFIFTVISLTRTCSSYEFYRHKLNPRLFNFYSIGRNLFIFHPQYLLLLFVHFSLITSKALTLLYLVMIVNYNFAEGAHSGTCSLGTLLKGGLNSSCGFVVKVGFLIFLYKLLYYGVISVIALPRCLCLVWSDFCKLWRGGLCKIRGKLTETVNLVLFPFHLISSQRHFMSSRIFINHLPNARLMTILVKIGPSILHLIGSAVFATFFYFDLIAVHDNTQFSFGFNNRNLPFIGLGVDFIHLLALTTWVFWADPQHIKTLTDEKILTLLLRMDTVPDEIDVTCSRNASTDVIRDVISQNKNFEINKEIIAEKIIELNLQLPESLPQRSTLVQKLRFKLKQAALNSSGVNRNNKMDYSQLLGEEE